ncbi:MULTISPECIES: hypothetical protein [Bacillus amyloliquefaciens group]|uniref:hypothetical protein n=1 Tax=Bacillus amyloliquefaciens group TaxID=1938374 RepID=UPI000EFC6652|nr:MULTISPECIES: hypothetical protein [Bacillus amyloliquefaciens group]MCV4329346.1 hypothetical protein [Bacillus velezensis]MDH3075827.1 hypothetical protein [Bacillus velezensis]MDH3104093.1 hypothetical protein [Bacillus velezensis]MDH3139003.1 hypothetical protein [Bacillus velezensis]MDQ8094843.1 hypothetical protein [Bacillus amyloliquefaciens]
MLLTKLKAEDLSAVLESNGLPATQANKEKIMACLGDRVQQQMRYYALASLSIEVRKNKNMFLNNSDHSQTLDFLTLDEVAGIAETEFKDIIHSEIAAQTHAHPTFITTVKNPSVHCDLYLSAVKRTIHHVIEAIACEYIKERQIHTADECIKSQYDDMDLEYDKTEDICNYECVTTLIYKVNQKQFSYTLNISFDSRSFSDERHCEKFVESVIRATDKEISKAMSNLH